MKLRYPLIAALVLAGAGLALLLRPAATPAAAPPAPSAMVGVMKLTPQPVALQVGGAGSVVAGPAQTDIILPAPGIVTGLYAHAGEAVTAGQVLAEIAPDAASVAGLRKAVNALSAATAAREHVAALLAQRLATRADLAAADQTLQDARSDLAALRASAAGTQRQVAAPFAGIVTAVSAVPGSLLPAGASLLLLLPASSLNIITGLAPADATQVRTGDPATVTLLNSGARIPATVTERAAMLDPQTGLVDVTLQPAGTVTLGEPVGVTITTGSITALEVPDAAVLSDAQGDFVYLLDPKNIAHRQTVRVLQSNGVSSVLAPGPDTGMRLATLGAYQLSDGMTATVQSTAP